MVRVSLQGKRVAFTGKLASCTRTEAWNVIRAAGGRPCSGVSRRTSMLVVGMRGWPLLPDGSISKMLQRAEALNRQGARIELISEATFLERVGLRDRTETTLKRYTSSEVCAMLDLSPETLRRWELLSLVRSDEGRFDYNDIVSLRTIVELVRAGVRPEVISSSIHRLRSVLPDIEQPLNQLKLVVDGSRALLAEIGAIRITPDGQLTLPFDRPADDAGGVVRMPEERRDWLDIGQTLEEQERFAEAEHAYRNAIAESPDDSAAYFNLANALRAMNRLDASAENFRAAIAHDPGFSEAYYNLADTLEESDQLEEAIACLESVLRIDSNFADAHFNLALLYERVGRPSDAASHWTAYLQFDRASEWADLARRHLAKQGA